MPSIKINLISLSKAQAAGIGIEYLPNSTKMIAKKKGGAVLIGPRKKQKICEIIGAKASKRKAPIHVLFTAKKDDSMTLMHKKMVILMYRDREIRLNEVLLKA